MERILFLSGGRKAGIRTGRPRALGAACGLAMIAMASAAGARAGNFVVHGGSADRCRQVAGHAESVRERAFPMLLGIESPRPWAVNCAIHLHASATSFAAAVGAPPGGARGATSIEFTGADVSLRRIDLIDDEPGVLPDALAHEIVHVVLADHFTTAPPPRWADEGLAVLFDDAVKQAGHEDDFRAARRTGTTWSAAHLLGMEELPVEPRRLRVFYGQSAALVRWLLARGGPRTLVAFLDDAATAGTGPALERHYGVRSPAALEEAWLADPDMPRVGGGGL